MRPEEANHDEQEQRQKAKKNKQQVAVAEKSGEPKPKLKRKEYEELLEPLQVELVKLQEWVKHTGAKIMVVFEGRDAAGKGGIIKAITERTSPRVFRIATWSSPSEREKSQMYFQRYLAHFPSAGEVILFEVKLPKRQKPGDYAEPDYPYHYVPAKY